LPADAEDLGVEPRDGRVRQLEVGSCPLPILTSFCPSRTSTVIPFENRQRKASRPDRTGSSAPSASFPFFLAKGVPDRNGSLPPVEKTAHSEGARGEEEDPDGDQRGEVRWSSAGPGDDRQPPPPPSEEVGEVVEPRAV